MAHHTHGGLDPSLVAALRQVVDDALAERASLKKNGHTNTQWLRQAVSIDKSTLQIILAIIGAIWWVGGEWQVYRRGQADQQSVMERQGTMATTQAEIERKLDEALALVNEQRMINAGVESSLSHINDRMNAMPTRNEWQALVRQQIVPLRERLDRVAPR